MKVKSERIEARVSKAEKVQLERAARLAGVSVSEFLIRAGVEQADMVIAESVRTWTVPPDYFDDLLEALDTPDHAPSLAAAVVKAKSGGRIAAR